jgi:hypothetical protein
MVILKNHRDQELVSLAAEKARALNPLKEMVELHLDRA